MSSSAANDHQTPPLDNSEQHKEVISAMLAGNVTSSQHNTSKQSLEQRVEALERALASQLNTKNGTHDCSPTNAQPVSSAAGPDAAGGNTISVDLDADGRPVMTKATSGAASDQPTLKLSTDFNLAVCMKRIDFLELRMAGQDALLDAALDRVKALEKQCGPASDFVTKKESIQQIKSLTEKHMELYAAFDGLRQQSAKHAKGVEVLCKKVGAYPTKDELKRMIEPVESIGKELLRFQSELKGTHNKPEASGTKDELTRLLGPLNQIENEWAQLQLESTEHTKGLLEVHERIDDALKSLASHFSASNTRMDRISDSIVNQASDYLMRVLGRFHTNEMVKLEHGVDAQLRVFQGRLLENVRREVADYKDRRASLEDAKEDSEVPASAWQDTTVFRKALAATPRRPMLDVCFEESEAHETES